MKNFFNKGLLQLIKPWFIWFICSLFYSHQYFSRVSVQTYAPNWTSQFLLSPVQLGFLAAAFMYIYLFMQPVAGVLINRFGIKSVLLVATFIATVGCFVLAFSHSYHQLLFARILLGLGGAFSLVGIVNLCHLIFDKQQFAIANGFTFTLGGIGALIAGTPLALLITQTSWQIAAIIAGIFSSGVFILLIFIIKNPSASNQTAFTHSWKTTRNNAIKTISTWNLWGPSLYSAFLFLPMTVFSNLWLEPFLISKYHHESLLVTLTSSIEFAGYIIGAPLLGFIFTKIKNKHALLKINSLILLILSILIIYDYHHPLFYLTCLIFAFGFFSATALLSIPMVRELLPQEELTIGFGITSFFLNFAGVIFLPIIGWSLENYDRISDKLINLDYSKFSLASYHHAFFFLPISIFLAFIFSFTIPRPD